jgi:PAS domain S-box-containing protein
MVSPDPSILGGIVAGLPVAVYRTSPDGRFVAGNAALVRLLGAASFEALSEVDVRSLYADPSQRDHLFRRVTEGEELPPEELEIIRLDGAPIWARIRSRGVLEDDGSIAYFEGVMEDVSELHAADERLRRSNALLDTLTKMQNRYIAGVDVGELFDGLLEELLTSTGSEYGFIAQLLHDDDGAFLRSWAMTDISWNEATQKMYDEFGPRGMEFHNLDTLFGRAVTGDGPIISNDPLHDPRTAGRPEGHPPLDSFLGVPIHKGDDVMGMVALANRPGGFDESMVGYLEPLAATVGSLIEAVVAERERRAAEAREQKAEELYRSVIEQAAEAIVSFRDDGTIEAANRAAAALVGLDVSEVVGSQLDRFVPDDRLEHFLMKGEEALRTGAPLEAAMVRADGTERPVEMSFVRSEFGAGPITTLIVRDIAERKAFEQALLEARDVAERTARAKDDFLAGISHELRTPLNSVIGLSAILGRELHGPLTDKQSEYVAQIESSGRHLLAIISNILDLAKLEADKLEADLTEIEVKGLVEEAAALMQELVVGKGLALYIDVSPDMPRVSADHLRAKQILLNLLSNAVKFTDEGGEVGIRARHEGHAVSIAVWDTGEGIPANKLQTVFEAFVQVDSSLARKHEGTGLGLTLSRRLADMQNGHLSAESIVGEGSVFTLTLPVASDAAG